MLCFLVLLYFSSLISFFQFLLDCSQFETVAVHESKRRALAEEKLNSYIEECTYLRKTLGAAMGLASRDEVLSDVEKIKEAEQIASQQLFRAPPGSSYAPSNTIFPVSSSSFLSLVCQA